jgi:hypothetical protein
MLSNKFVQLLIDLIWMSGLFAIVLAFAYMVQDRRGQWQDDGYSWSVPRMLVPLYGALATFCFGLALHAYAAQQPVSLWITIVWALLAVSFAVRMIKGLLIGIQHGWNTRLNARFLTLDSASYGEQTSRIPVWGGIVTVLLIVNLFLLGRWGSIQINSGAFAQQRSGNTEETETTPAPSVAAANANAGQLTGQAAVTGTVSVVVVEVTATATVEPTREEPAPVSTPVPQLVAQENVTPTTGVITVPVPINTLLPALQSPQASVTVQNAKGANVRRGPSLEAEIITVIADGTVAPVEGRTGDNQWFFIRLPDGQTGWISVIVAMQNQGVHNSPILE